MGIFLSGLGWWVGQREGRKEIPNFRFLLKPSLRTVGSGQNINKVTTARTEDNVKSNAARGADNPDSPEFVPQPGQCGIAGDGAEFVYGR